MVYDSLKVIGNFRSEFFQVSFESGKQETSFLSLELSFFSILIPDRSAERGDFNL